ncbi:Hypothetical predicted protein [Marmota monax]|uniref:Uncharacterized protein n=1 Tax=Marmota monax TaxID=9995 RepID=A0A5E4BU62_MARMO|nr:Hypothetical predicted protein [Marmota monax]
MLCILTSGSSSWKNVALPSPAAGAQWEGAGGGGSSPPRRALARGSERRGGCWRAREAPYSLDGDNAQPPSGGSARSAFPTKDGLGFGQRGPDAPRQADSPVPSLPTRDSAVSRVNGGLQGASLRGRRRFPTASSPASHAGGGRPPQRRAAAVTRVTAERPQGAWAARVAWVAWVGSPERGTRRRSSRVEPAPRASTPPLTPPLTNESVHRAVGRGGAMAQLANRRRRSPRGTARRGASAMLRDVGWGIGGGTGWLAGDCGGARGLGWGPDLRRGPGAVVGVLVGSSRRSRPLGPIWRGQELVLGKSLPRVGVSRAHPNDEHLLRASPGGGRGTAFVSQWLERAGEEP